MSRNSTQLLLGHMLESAREAHGYVAALERPALDTNRLLQHGLVRCIEVIGEAAARLDSDFRESHTEVPWHKIIAMRNRLVHAYFDIDLDVVWSTAKIELPKLIRMLEALSAEYRTE